ncbi:VCBS repeat-containing protein [candidate division WOR-3 bacterium]|nr:VCBS repeat-containing protein [candidate division WOR-3 bacterium]
MDWNSDGEWDIVSGDRDGYFNVFIREGGDLTAYYMVKLMDSTVLDAGYNSQPAVVDWDGDGMKDLLLGTETGYIRFYPNRTSDTWPMFQDFTDVVAGGAAIYLNRVNPYVFDLDQDGVQDLICGANDGYVRFYRNTGTNANPVLAAAETLRTTTGTPARASGNAAGSRCGFGDWNNDGTPDFLISAFDGMVELFLGAPVTAVEQGARPSVLRCRPEPTVVRTTLRISSPPSHRSLLLAADGRLVMPLTAGANDVSHLAPGVYFVRSGFLGEGPASTPSKVIIGR